MCTSERSGSFWIRSKTVGCWFITGPTATATAAISVEAAKMDSTNRHQEEDMISGVIKFPLRIKKKKNKIRVHKMAVLRTKGERWRRHRYYKSIFQLFSVLKKVSTTAITKYSTFIELLSGTAPSGTPRGLAAQSTHKPHWHTHTGTLTHRRKQAHALHTHTHSRRNRRW